MLWARSLQERLLLYLPSFASRSFTTVARDCCVATKMSSFQYWNVIFGLVAFLGTLP